MGEGLYTRHTLRRAGGLAKSGNNAPEEYNSNEMIKNESDGIEQFQPTNNDQLNGVSIPDILAMNSKALQVYLQC